MVTTQVGPQVEEFSGFLNSWLIPNDTRVATDELPALAADARGWRERFPALPRPRRGELPELTALRDDLRADIAERGTGRLQGWLERHPQRVGVDEHGALTLAGA